MISKKLNCWEYMKCGREPGGMKAAELGICLAATDASFDGINSGKCGGRFCWAVAGTFCHGKIQGTFAIDRDSCLSCGFFNRVQAEEGTANLRTKFLMFVSPDAKNSLLNIMAYKHIKSGERFITQGEVGDTAYIIHRGSCQVIVEKDGELHPVDHRGEGDIVGMMSIVTGEPRSAHVEAESDMDVWVLNKTQFDDISRKDVELLSFLTEIVADRFDSRRPTAKRRIGKYVATDIIGRGAYSIVYKGVHRELGMPVAIKMMRHDLVSNSDFLRDFRNEAKIIARLNHENIIKVYDIEERFRTVFIIMEYLEGESLKDRLLRLKVIPPMLAVDYLIQICFGLDYAHQQGIIHRDINTLNLFLQSNRLLKIIDFGLACPIGFEDFHLGGAFPYLAPELFDGEPGSQQTDVYALGITAYEMVVGERPYPEENASALMKLHRNQDIPDPTVKVPNLPELLRKFILTACRRDPAQRYPNMSSALEDLKPLAGRVEREPEPIDPSKPNMTTLFLEYNDSHQQELKRLLEEFRLKVNELGVGFKTEDFFS